MCKRGIGIKIFTLCNCAVRVCLVCKRAPPLKEAEIELRTIFVVSHVTTTVQVEYNKYETKITQGRKIKPHYNLYCPACTAADDSYVVETTSFEI